jgi:REP element-mobilizing transposase RayT
MAKPHTPLPNGMHSSAYGGILRNYSRRRGARAVSTRFTMHVVLRSTLAKGLHSFTQPKNRAMIKRVLAKHASRSNVDILSLANAGNHLHLKIKVHRHRDNYLRFIRAVTGEIALHMKRGSARGAKAANAIQNSQLKRRFWDHRPFSTIVSTIKYAEQLTRYFKVNRLQGLGYPREFAELYADYRDEDGS